MILRKVNPRIRRLRALHSHLFPKIGSVRDADMKKNISMKFMKVKRLDAGTGCGMAFDEILFRCSDPKMLSSIE